MSASTGAKENPDDAQHQFRERRLQMASAFLLGIATFASSWSSYQSAHWNGQQATKYSRAIGFRAESGRAWTITGQTTVVDIGFFAEWLNAHMSGDTDRESRYRAYFRPEFVPAFEAWLAKSSVTNAGSRSNPFLMPEYNLGVKREAKHLEELADRTFKEGLHANEMSERYVSHTVILSGVLFLAGIVLQFTHPNSRKAVLGLAALICLWALIRMGITAFQ